MMKKVFILAVLMGLSASVCSADDFLSVSGRLNLRGVVPFDGKSETEYPSLTGRLKIDTPQSDWRFHSWIEGGWDGSVRLPARDRSFLKLYDEVYQSSTPYLEFKEMYVSYTKSIFELRAGIQRFAWGRLDEYPVNDLLNPWDYTQFLRKPLEDRKIGVPSLSASLTKDKWSCDLVWVPMVVPYRLPLPNERWSGITGLEALMRIPGTDVEPREAKLPSRFLKDSSVGLRLRHAGDVEWALNLFHGFDPRPVFKTTALIVYPLPGRTLVDPGYVPDFHKITSIGFDAATVKGDWSIRAEAAYSLGRYFNTRREFWGYPLFAAPGVYPLLPNQRRTDTLDYGVSVDYRLFEDGILTLQAQQTVIMNRTEMLYDRKVETLLWANLKAGWLNQKVETNFNIAYNPEHGDLMAKANAWYVFTDSWKAGLTAITFTGPSPSLFGRFSRNDQLEAEVIFQW